MLGKLLKQEFGATARYFIPLYGIILVLTPLFALMMRMMQQLDMDSVGLNMLSGMAVFGILGYSFLIIAIFIATLILIVIRFYKTTATSEAYLTFTLPVKTHQIIISKTLAAVVWEILAGIIAVFSVIVMFCLSGFITLSEMLDGLRSFLDSFLFHMNGSDYLTFSLILVSLITGVFASIMKVYCSIALGQLFRSHRILISIGLYFAIYFGLQIVSMILSVGGIMILQDDSYSHSYFNFTYLVSILENIAVSAAGFIVTTYIMKKHLNVM